MIQSIGAAINTIQTGETSYDRVEYRGYPFQQTHPDRLATLATLFGLSPAPADACRVLELGCGDGGNLVPMAFALPGSEFIGVDLSAHAIAGGQEMITKLGLKNIELRRGDIMTFDPGEYRFDYIIAHGVYSWVPEEVRDRIMALCRELLAPHGVAYISYNTYPGYRLREITRDMMLFHTRGMDNPAEEVEEGLGLLRLLLRKFPSEQAAGRDFYGALLTEQLDILTEHRHAEVIYHDDLAAVNAPVYFHQFAAHAERHGLQYLGEANYFEMQDECYPPAIREFLKQFDDRQIVIKEQYLDFLKCRVFRQTLLCRGEVPVDRVVDAALIPRFYLSSSMRPASSEPDLRAGIAEEFQGWRGGKLKTDYPLAKAALLYLGRCWPRAVGWEELLPSARAILSEADFDLPSDAESTIDNQITPQGRTLAEILLMAYRTGMVELQLQPSRFVTEIGPYPVASRLARSQARRGQVVTNLMHRNVEIDDALGRELLMLLDGSRNRAALCDEMAALIAEREALPSEKRFIGDKSESKIMIADAIETYLQRLSRMALLID